MEFVKNEISIASIKIAENDIFSEILDLTKILQYFVKNSHLHFKLENIEKIHGIFNPCISDIKPIMIIK